MALEDDFGRRSIAHDQVQVNPLPRILLMRAPGGTDRNIQALVVSVDPCLPINFHAGLGGRDSTSGPIPIASAHMIPYHGTDYVEI